MCMGVYQPRHNDAVGDGNTLQVRKASFQAGRAAHGSDLIALNGYGAVANNLAYWLSGNDSGIGKKNVHSNLPLLRNARRDYVV